MKAMKCQKNFCREQLLPKKRFDKRSFRMKAVPGRERTYIVLACPVGKWKPRKQACAKSMKAQSILRPLSNSKCGACRVKRKRR